MLFRSLVIADGQSAIAFMSVAFDRSSRIPDRLLHHVSAVDSAAEGAVIATHHTELHVLGPPVEGASWLAADGPSNDRDNHHRRGVVILDGRAVDSRRYAIDWKQIRDGASFSGDARDVRSYYSYGKAVLAVADGRVATARDGLPDNIPDTANRSTMLCRLRWKRLRETQSRSTWVTVSLHITCICNRGVCA